MRTKILIVSLIFLFIVSCNEKSGNKADRKPAKIEFEETNHDFSDVEFGGDASFDFKFTNKGKSPLILDDVRSTCGCTVPEWTKEPINESGTGDIRVIYDSRRVGAFSKTLIVYSNAENSPVRLFIKGRILPYEENPAESLKNQ